MEGGRKMICCEEVKENLPQIIQTDSCLIAQECFQLDTFITQLDLRKTFTSEQALNATLAKKDLERSYSPLASEKGQTGRGVMCNMWGDGGGGENSVHYIVFSLISLRSGFLNNQTLSSFPPTFHFFPKLRFCTSGMKEMHINKGLLVCSVLSL